MNIKKFLTYFICFCLVGLTKVKLFTAAIPPNISINSCIGMQVIEPRGKFAEFFTTITQTRDGFVKIEPFINKSKSLFAVSNCSGDNDFNIRIWNVLTGECTQTFINDSFIHSIAFSPNCELMASQDIRGQIKLWDINSGACLHTYDGEFPHSTKCLAFSPNGKFLTFEEGSRTITLLNVETWTPLGSFSEPSKWRIENGGSAMTLAISPNSSFLAINNKLQDITSGNTITTWEDFLYNPERLVFNPNGQQFAFTSLDKSGLEFECKVYNIGSLAASFFIKPPYLRAKSPIKFSPDGSTLAVGTNSGTVFLYDAYTGNEKFQLHYKKNIGVRSINFIKNGYQIICGFEGGIFIIYTDLEHGKNLKQHKQEVLALAACQHAKLNTESLAQTLTQNDLMRILEFLSLTPWQKKS